MNEMEQRIVIAEACGIEVRRLVHDKQYATHEMALDAGCPELEGTLVNDEEWEAIEPPDYVHDLNAMHEAEMLFECKDLNGPDLAHKYLGYLGTISYRNFMGDIRATAAQRAEAFLKTLGLWKD